MAALILAGAGKAENSAPAPPPVKEGKAVRIADQEDDLTSDSSPDIPLPLRQQRESFLI